VQFRIYLAAFISQFMDISETDKKFVIRAKLPAVKKEDVQVTASAGVLQSAAFPCASERTDARVCRRAASTVAARLTADP
jgi:HSP20 family molecular chaperone IbpA